MASDKSLAAEIEAVKLALHQRLPIDDDLADDAAKHIVRTVIAPRLAEIAALQSRAFEDGAPSLVARQAVAAMRRSYEHFDQQAALADCRDYQLGYHSGIRSALQAVGLWDAGRAALAEQEKGDA